METIHCNLAISKTCA